jgi:hypothetical protein
LKITPSPFSLFLQKITCRMREFVARGVDAILNETQRAGRRSKGLEVQKIYPRLAANGARVATREAREGQKLHILPFFSKSRVL